MSRQDEVLSSSLQIVVWVLRLDLSVGELRWCDRTATSIAAIFVDKGKGYGVFHFGRPLVTSTPKFRTFHEAAIWIIGVVSFFSDIHCTLCAIYMTP